VIGAEREFIMADRQNETVDQPVVRSIDRASLPVVPAGEQLIEHEVYLDLANLGHGPIVAMPGQMAASGNDYVAQKDLDPATWDLLVRENGEAGLQAEDEVPAETLD
jgi:hypothetical protein